ncbi:MAG: hypothetical protein ACKVS9_16945 [Phycisphaerae bacterium]
MSRSRFGLFAAVALLAATAQAQTPLNGAISYQGRLDSAGAPANGTFDFIFRLYDAASLGNQVGSTLTVNDLAVADGLFTVQLNFGFTAYDGDARWLDVQVRAGASAGAYTLLAPRQSLTAAPFALFALDGGNWNKVGSAITNSNAGSFVGVNRSAQVSGAEYFGIQAPAQSTNYGGMYIRTDSDQAKPFYGYRAGAAGSSMWTYLDGANGDWRVYNGADRLTVQSNGEVGIGVADPGAKLDITGSSGVTLRATNTGTGFCAQFTVNSQSDTANGIYAATYGGGYGGSFEAHNTNSTAALNAYKNGGPALRCISTLTTPGTAATDCVVSVVGGTDTEPSAGGFVVMGSVAGPNISIDSNEIMARNDGAVAPLALNADGGNVTLVQSGTGAVAIGTTTIPAGVKFVVNGTARVDVLEIAGADVAEKFPVSCNKDLKPGTVVMIDSANPGKLCLARGAYNKRVAGVISGGNGLPAGTILGNLPGHEDAPAVALSGRVWVYCDATEHAIEAGDLLTTSDTPGHAMLASDASRSHGAVIGKAMTELGRGETGMVLVLVNLQ